MAISKNRIKYIKSLELKKKRNEEKVFLAEGPKLINDLMGIFHCCFLAGTDEWISLNPNVQADEVSIVSREELSQTSLLKTPQQVLAIFAQPEYDIKASVINDSLCLALDGIQDPGNLGTIIRLADWFGIENIFCSLNSADVYNPKVVQATMGAIARVKIKYTSLTELINSVSADASIYGTFLNGNNMYTESLSEAGLIIMGNEGNGITKEVEKLINKRLYIPNYPMQRDTSESLNVAIATAVVCAEFRRQASSPQN